MKNIVVHMTECKPHSTVASARVARFISETIGVDLVDTKEKAEACVGSVDTLIIVNGPMAFCDFLEALGALVTCANKVVWVQQDYAINPPAANSKAESPFRKAFADKKLRPVYWTTCKKNVVTPEDKYINWNQLTYDSSPFKIMKENRILYYGAFREKRISSFERFFKEPGIPLTISTTTLRRKKFEAMGINCKFVPAFENVIKDACHYDAAIYIEDDKSHKEFHSPANRFYEMLSAGVPIFFDVLSKSMLEEAGIVVPDKWLVKDGKELYQKYSVADLVGMRAEQRSMWEKDYVGELRQALIKAWEK